MRTLTTIKADLECESKALIKKRATKVKRYGSTHPMSEEYFLFIKSIRVLQERIQALKAEYKEAKIAVNKDPTKWDIYSLGE